MSLLPDKIWFADIFEISKEEMAMMYFMIGDIEALAEMITIGSLNVVRQVSVTTMIRAQRQLSIIRERSPGVALDPP